MEGLTFKSKIGHDDIKQQFEYLIEKQRETVRLLCAGNYGIVSDVDTSLFNSSLFPTIEGNILYFTSGIVVTKAGDSIELKEFSINMPSVTEDTLVVYSYELVGSKEKRISNSGKAFSVWFEPKETAKSISFIPVSKYSVLRDNEVCLAVIRVGSENYIDTTNTYYKINRPWFSLCDVEHREQKGTGSSDVPHSIGLNDLTSSNLTIYDQLLTRGMIISKDLAVAGISGHIYDVKGTYSIDSTGSFIELADGTFPNALLSVTNQDGKEICCHLVKGTRKIALDKQYTDEELSNLTIQVCITETLLCNTEGTQLNEISFTNQSEGDTIITQGLQVNLSDTNVSFSDCSDFKKTFEIVVNKDGTIHKEPEILGYTLPVSDINQYDFSQEFDVPVRLQIYRVTGGWDGTLVLHITGISTDGSEVEEYMSLVMNGTSLSEFSTNYYKSITSVSCEEFNTADIVIFAYSNRAIDRRLKVARVTWDGERVTDIQDIRPISTVIQDPYKINVVKEAATNVINSLRARGKQVTTILVEDFNSPEYLDLNNVLWVTSNDGINYPIIPAYLPLSDDYLSCYRSRALNFDNNGDITVYAYLVNADESTANSKSVRIVGCTDEYYDTDIIMEPQGNGLFKAIVSSNYNQSKIVVSGKASGISVFVYNGD